MSTKKKAPAKRAAKKQAAAKPVPARARASASTRSASSQKSSSAATPRAPAPSKARSAAPVQLELGVEHGRRQYVAGRVLGSLIVYFRAETKDVVASATRAFADWGDALPVARCTWWRRHDQQDFQSVNARTWESVFDQIARAKARYGARFVQHDPAEKDADDVSMVASAAEVELALLGRGSSGYSMRASYLRMTPPRTELAADARRFRDLVLSTCEQLPVRSGSVGYTLSTGFIRKRDKGVDRALDDIYFALPALELEDHVSNLVLQADRLRGVGWLTLLGADAQKALGGERRIAERVGSSVELHRTAHALVLQAGSAPVLGDDPASLEPYRAVYAAVRPLIDPLSKLLTPEGKAVFQRLA